MFTVLRHAGVCGFLGTRHCVSVISFCCGLRRSDEGFRADTNFDRNGPRRASALTLNLLRCRHITCR
jgi:hypothetical protein